MKLLYNISIHLFSVLLWCAQPFVAKARLMVRGRRGQRFCPSDGSRTTDKVICVHCASLGEFEQGRPLIEAIAKRYPSYRLVLTFFSPSGYEIRKNYSGVDAVYYLPLDTPRATRRFARELAPDVVIFVKYEYWYNILRQLKLHGAKIYVVSAIFRPTMSFFSPTWKGGVFFRNMLRLFDAIFVQDEASVSLLGTIGLSSNVILAGDTRFDRVADLVDSAKELPEVDRFVDRSFTVVCGSTWGPDEELLTQLMHSKPEWRFIVAPHEISSERIEKMIAQSGRKAVKYSQIGATAGDETLLVVDCIGILSSLYRFAGIAYIGGGFGVGIHNTLEAATWGVPVVFGPSYERFREAVGLVDCGAARSIASYDELRLAMDYFHDNRAVCGALSSGYVASNIGATDRILDLMDLS